MVKFKIGSISLSEDKPNELSPLTHKPISVIIHFI